MFKKEENVCVYAYMYNTQVHTHTFCLHVHISRIVCRIEGRGTVNGKARDLSLFILLYALKFQPCESINYSKN